MTTRPIPVVRLSVVESTQTVAFGLAAMAVAWGSARAETLGKRVTARLGHWLSFVASLLFAFADTLPWLFAARLVQGAADVGGHLVVLDRFQDRRY